MGAAVATVAAYVVMFLGMTWYAQRVFPVPYQWRRVFTAVAAALALLLLGRQLGGFTAALGLSLAYPLALLLLGFFLPLHHGAAVATVAAYVVMFLGMTWYAQLVFPVPYQWRRVLTAVAAALALLLVGRQLGGFAAALGLSLAYPLALLLLGFFLPEERRSLLARVGR